MPIDGNCQTNPAAGQYAAAFKYNAIVNVACHASKAKTGSVAINDPRTTCCK
jgi:hypothetical protein